MIPNIQQKCSILALFRAISTPSVASSISRFESNGTFLGPSQTTFKALSQVTPRRRGIKNCRRMFVVFTFVLM